MVVSEEVGRDWWGGGEGGSRLFLGFPVTFLPNVSIITLSFQHMNFLIITRILHGCSSLWPLHSLTLWSGLLVCCGADVASYGLYAVTCSLLWSNFGLFESAVIMSWFLTLFIIIKILEIRNKRCCLWLGEIPVSKLFVKWKTLESLVWNVCVLCIYRAETVQSFRSRTSLPVVFGEHDKQRLIPRNSWFVVSRIPGLDWVWSFFR